MASLRILSGSQVCEIMKKHGFMEVKKRGIHIVMQKQIPLTSITIPVPDHDKLRRGTLQGIIRQSKLPGEEFD